MENQYKELLNVYQEKNGKSYNFLNRGIEILRTLLYHNYESYIIGSAVRNFYLGRPIDLIEIVCSANIDQLKAIYPSLIIDKKGNTLLKDAHGYFHFIQFNEDILSLSKKHAEKHYNKKLIKTLESKSFTVDSLAITPTFQIIDIFGGLESLDSMTLKTIDTPKALFQSSPMAILDALELVAKYNFKFDGRTIKMISKYSSHLEDIKEQFFIRKLRAIICGEYASSAIKAIYKNKFFKYVHVYDVYIKKIYNKLKYFNDLEKVSILYLIIGQIPDAASIDKDELQEITENITITQLVATGEITNMMVYNIGVEKLLSANKMASLYKSNYQSQEKKIKKLAKKAVISSIRELNYTNLELVKLLNGDRGIKVKIIMNLLLERVINKEVVNHNVILKEEAKKINREIDEIFNYEEPVIPIEYTDEMIEELQKKYQKELDFLVKVYLHDEKELYELTALEREECVTNAKTHAKEFLLETSQYKILEQRGLI